MKQLFCIIVFFLSITYTSSQTYYHAFGENHPITVNENLVLVYFDKTKTTKTEIESKFRPVKEISLSKGKGEKLYAYEISLNGISYTMALDSLKKQNYVWDIEPVIGTTHTVPVSNIFYVKLKSPDDTVLLQAIASVANVEIIGNLTNLPLWYKLESNKQSMGNAVEMSNMFGESNLFDDVDPGFIYEVSFCTQNCPTDDSLSAQWGLEAINACEAWEITTGNSAIKVALFDSGMDENHSEFIGTNIFDSYNAELCNNTVFPNGFHGTHVGGIMFANHNYAKCAGISPDVSVMNMQLPGDTASNENFLEAVLNAFAELENHNYQIDVINNSWGINPDDITISLTPFLIDVKTAITTYRNGNKCVFVFGSGNNTAAGILWPSLECDSVLVVGAVNPSLYKSSTSAYGSQLDVVAPGVNIFSAMPNNQYARKTGTSQAAPHVSGVAALMLSVNPNLTAAQVARIIKGTAQRVNSSTYTYAYSANHLNGSWNVQMGHGLVDAAAAVSYAASSVNDLYIRDNSNDNGAEPYYTTDAVNSSPDIKVKTLSGYEVTSLIGGTTYKIEVTVRNCGENTISFNPNTLYTYWIANTSSPVWKNGWYSPGSLCGMDLGGTITAAPSGKYPIITPGSSCTITRQWTAPSIGGCISPYYSTSLHLVAKVNDGFLTIGENDTLFPLDQFVKTNNNVAWHQYTLSLDPVFSAITSISPNPTSGLTVVSYRLGENYRSGASLAVVTAMGNRVMTVPITAGDSEGSANLNLQSVPGGQYIIQLIAGSDVLDAKPLVVE